MAHIDRDYTKKTTKQISKEIDDYFDEDGNLNWINSILFKWEFFSIRGETASSYKKYVKSLGAKRDEVLQKIDICLRQIETVEKKYSKELLVYKSKTDSYVHMVNNLSDCISLKNFHNTYDFSKLQELCYNDKINVIDLKIYDILEKDCNEWTDEELEIVAYVYCNTNDDELKEQIVNSFYSESTDERFTSDNMHKYIAYKYYDRNEEQWDKFVELEHFYYEDAYTRYLNGDENVDIEKCTKNNLEISHLDDDKYSFLVAMESHPIEYNEDGEIKLCIPKYKEIQIGNQRNATIADGKPFYGASNKYENLGDKETFCVYNVDSEKGEVYIDEKIKEDSLYTEQTNVAVFFIEKAIDEGVGAAADAVIPGSGIIAKAIKKATKAGYKAVKSSAEVQTNDSKAYKLLDIENYVQYFGFMVVHTSDGISVMHTPESIRIVEEWMQLLEKKYKNNNELYKDAYEAYIKNKTIDSYVNGEIDIYAFSRYITNVSDSEINSFFN